LVLIGDGAGGHAAAATTPPRITHVKMESRITGLVQPLDVCGCFRSISSRAAEFYEEQLDGFAPLRNPLFLKEVAEISREYSTLRSFQLCSLLGAPARRWEHRLRDKCRSACFECARGKTRLCARATQRVRPAERSRRCRERTSILGRNSCACCSRRPAALPKKKARSGMKDEGGCNGELARWKMKEVAMVNWPDA